MAHKDQKILVAMGSKSDWPTMEHALDVLKEFSVFSEVQIVSAHRTPERIDELAVRLEQDEFTVVLAGAGGAAHLAGAIAARTVVPVIGVPITSALHGFDSLLSTVQMPAGIPVATVSIGIAGAKNAALLAVQIASRSDQKLRDQLRQHRCKLSSSVPMTPTSAEASE